MQPDKMKKHEKNTINLIINDKPVFVKEDKTILEACQESGINIPTLCYYKGLTPWSGCRFCVVEVSEKLVPACSTPVKDEMKVLTDTEKIKWSRKFTIELMLAKSPDVVELQALAAEYGVEKVRFKKEDDECILCGLCVRTCNILMKGNAIDFVGRGSARKIQTPFEEFSKTCTECGACNFLCPTGAIRKIQGRLEKAQHQLSEFDEQLVSRPNIYIPFPQAVPNVPVIDRQNCVYFLNEGCRACEKFCEADAIDYNQEDEKIKLKVGAMIVSLGFDIFDLNSKKEFHYKKYKNVISSMEFERILSASGPFKGEIIRLSDHKKPESIAFIQCVGSRDSKKGNEYCSSVCCMYTAKQAIIAKEHLPDLSTTVFALDVRAYGKEFEKYYERAKNQYGVKYVNSLISKLIEVPENKNILIKYVDDNGEIMEEEFNMVILAAGLCPSKDTNKLAEILGVELNEYGFIKTGSFSPAKTTREGIYVGGVSKEPGDIPKTVIDSSCASANVSQLLSEKRWTETVEKFYPEEKDVSEEEERIGVYVCSCGRNIASVVDVAKVAEEAKKLDNVVFVSNALYTCSQDSLEDIKENIKKHNLNRLVVAACSPRTHEELFRDTVREARLNKYLFEMTNIRDQCSWVHMNFPEEATEKAIELVKMAVSKARLLTPIETVFSDINKSCLVVGGGISGMIASISLSEQGFKVHLVEKNSELGGEARSVYSNLEGENVKEKLDKIINEVKNAEKIKIYMTSEVIENTGFTGNLLTKIKNTNGEITEIEHGAMIIATGARENVPKSYMYGESKRVMTQKELGELIHKGEIDSDIVDVVMIQCVEFRDDDRPYCSKICCSNAIKNALKLKEINSDINIYVLFRDIMTYGFREKYYLKARDRGIKFIRYNKDNKPEVIKKDEKLAVSVFDEVIGEDMIIAADMVVLSSGIVPLDTNEKLSKILKLPLTQDGFFLEAHAKLKPLDFSKAGFYMCGLAHSPSFIDEAISGGYAAAIRAASLLARDKIESTGITAVVNEMICRGCGLCIDVCPYDARKIDEEKNVLIVNEVLCQGCGACVVACPSGASYQRGFKKEQIFAMIEEVK